MLETFKMDETKVMEVMRQFCSFKEVLGKLNMKESPSKYSSLWKKTCIAKRIEEDNKKINWAKQSVNLNLWQQIIYEDILKNINNKNNKIYFIVNATKVVGPATLKRKYVEITPEEQEKELQLSLEQKNLVVEQNNKLIEALIKESILRRQIGQAACLMKNIYSHGKMRQPNNKYLSQTKRKMATYDRTIFDLNGTTSSRKTWDSFLKLLDSLIQETNTPLIFFYRKHFPYEDIPEGITPVVYEITNMYPDGVVNGITHEPAFKCLQPAEIKKKSSISRRFFNRCREQKKEVKVVAVRSDIDETPEEQVASVTLAPQLVNVDEKKSLTESPVQVTSPSVSQLIPSPPLSAYSRPPLRIPVKKR